MSAAICAACVLVATTAAHDGARETDLLPFGERASFRVDKRALRSDGASPALIGKVDASAFRYFRLLAPQFALRTCDAFRDLRWRLPPAAVHGDAHVEQFVITDTSYGLEDFDRAGLGPAVVDLVRYAASVRLACRAAPFPCDADRAVASYFQAYRGALDRPVERAQPAIVDRLRASAPQDVAAWLRSIDALMQPLSPAESATLRRGWGRFVDLMRETRPDRPDTYYAIVRVGHAEIGVGSALERKTLIRVAGPSAAPDDDVILEARVTAAPTGRECVTRPATGGSLHVLTFSYQLGPRMPDVFGFVPREGTREAPELWLHSWDPGYRELTLDDINGQADLEALAVDAARQLAGHFWTRFPEPLRAHQRFAQLRAFELTEARARAVAIEFAGETIAEWQRFRRQR